MEQPLMDRRERGLYVSESYTHTSRSAVERDFLWVQAPLAPAKPSISPDGVVRFRHFPLVVSVFNFPLIQKILIKTEKRTCSGWQIFIFSLATLIKCQLSSIKRYFYSLIIHQCHQRLSATAIFDVVCGTK